MSTWSNTTDMMIATEVGAYAVVVNRLDRVAGRYVYRRATITVLGCSTSYSTREREGLP
jgi:hypothetical protein